MVTLAFFALGPFRRTTSSEDLVRTLFGDRVVVGGVHVVVLAAAAYIVASIAALIVEGRWINEIGRGGAKVDAANTAGSAAIAELTSKLAAKEAEVEDWEKRTNEVLDLAERAVVVGERLQAENDALKAAARGPDNGNVG